MRHHDEIDSTLSFDKETMRAMGYETIDLIVEHLDRLGTKPATGFARRRELEEKLRESPPNEPSTFSTILQRVNEDVLTHIMWPNHPRHFAWVPGPSNYVGTLADAIASAYNICPGTWLESSGPAQIELTTLDWIRQWCGLPDSAGGILVSGGSMANLTAIATARRIKLTDRMGGAVVYCSEQVHSSVVRNLRILGFQPSQIRRLPTDRALKLSVSALESAVEEDRRANLNPFCIIATAGTTNTATVDPLPDIRRLCDRHNLWFHIDGAYGAAAVLSPSAKNLLEGLGSADSLAVDPHKWLFQPFEIGCCLVRDSRWLVATFSERPEYLQDTWADLDPEKEVNFGERGVQLTRGFRALKLWMTVKVFGEAALRGAIERGIRNAEIAQAELLSLGCFEIVTPAQLAVVTFRYVGAPQLDPDRLTKAIYDSNRKRGFSMLTTTTIRGRKVLRMCTINPRTSEQDLRETIRVLSDIGRETSQRLLQTRD